MKKPATALIDEARCIGCARCLEACPVDAIVGAHQQMHTVVEPWCIGCRLCLPACPVDCIVLAPVGLGSGPSATGERTGWAAWSEEQAAQARERYAFHKLRVARDKRENDERLAAKAAHKLADLANQTLETEPAQLDRKRAVIEAALARARAQRKNTAP